MPATLVKEDKMNLTETNQNIDYFLTKLENADNKSKNEIENLIVNIGDKAVPELVDKMQVVKGTVRGIVAMILIRIGEPSVDYLKRAAKINKDFEWIAKYLITEINGIAA